MMENTSQKETESQSKTTPCIVLHKMEKEKENLLREGWLGIFCKNLSSYQFIMRIGNQYMLCYKKQVVLKSFQVEVITNLKMEELTYFH